MVFIVIIMKKGGKKVNIKVRTVKSMGVKKNKTDNKPEKISESKKIKKIEKRKLKSDKNRSGINLLEEDSGGIKNKKQEKEQSKPKTEKIFKEKPVDYEKLQRDKRLILISGVTFFMVLIVSVWFINIREVFNSVPAYDEDDTTFSWKELSEEFKDNIEQMKEEIEEIKILADNSTTTSAEIFSTTTMAGLPGNEDVSATTSTSTIINSDKINELKDKLQNLTNEE